ncbi:MAG: acylneuraminate cytidylyltransferase family protein [Alphaproteobacteria bacterium]|nr:acylneuraminate cytidylyltransferase family protein [Alphaproteobacteria bacterium]
MLHKKTKRNSVVAIITARGGSVGLPRKNIKELAGKPLIAYSIEAGVKCPLIDAVVVTTDDDEIAVVSRTFGAEIIDRPADLATDTASSYDTIKHALEALAVQGKIYSHFVLLQPTSPLRTAIHLEECLSKFFKSNANSAISVCKAEHHPYKAFIVEQKHLKPLFGEEYLAAPRQTLPPIYCQNGALYVMGCNDFLNKTDNFYLPPVMPYVMGIEESLDIDTEQDLALAEFLIKNKTH